MRSCLFCLILTLFAPIAEAKTRYIKSVRPISVQAPQGIAPSLPWQVWVTYTDGTGEWRQTRWSNSQRQVEQGLTQNTAGTQYTVSGHIIGDNTTSSGYPIQANVLVTAASDADVTPSIVAQPLPLGSVRLIGQNRLTSNRDLDVRTLLSLDLSQQLYNYRDTYGLSTEGYTESDGWDSPTTKLKGHGTGHYMSALAFAYATQPAGADRDSLLSRIRTIVSQLKECQERTFVWSDSLGRYFEARDLAPEPQLQQLQGTWQDFDRYKQDWQHYGYGYLNAIPAQHPVLIEMYRAYNNEEWVWAPYYTIHKQLAGLVDIALCVDDAQVSADALQIAKLMGLWVWNRLHYRTYVQTEGSPSERKARPGNRYEMWNMYIAGEVGGMAESLARLSEMVTDRTERERLLEAASYFDAPAFFSPLSQNIDDIRTRHANQHIPMITGALREYRDTGRPAYYRIARNFWDMVQGRYVYAMGGVGNGEMFRQPYSQVLSMNTNIMSDRNRDMYPNPDINETCCAYNLAKLTKDLNSFTPDDASLMDYYERVLSNQIVGSLNPSQWECTYQYAVGLNAVKPFGNETPQSSCCGGTGVENHVKYQEAAYFANDTCLWVALYLPTEADALGVTLRQDCQWPAQHSTLTVTRGTGRFALKLRVPSWATSGFTVTLNGRKVASNPQPSSYVVIPQRQWQEGDRIEVDMPFTAHIYYGQDKMDLAATGKNETQTRFAPMWTGVLMYGPLAMASTDIRQWSDAEYSLKSDLSDLTLLGAQGTDGTGGPLYSLTLSGHSFLPDYYVTTHSTHYLRLDVQSRQQKKSRKADKSALEQAVTLAQGRIAQPEAWAPHGMQRLQTQLAAAQQVLQTPDKQLSQSAIDESLSLLNMAINTMRPSNLAEPEDLSQLLPMLSSAKNIPNKTTALREAIDYADMVVQYVNDGSGTHDLITKATRQLEAALPQ